MSVSLSVSQEAVPFTLFLCTSFGRKDWTQGVGVKKRRNRAGEREMEKESADRQEDHTMGGAKPAYQLTSNQIEGEEWEEEEEEEIGIVARRLTYGM